VEIARRPGKERREKLKALDDFFAEARAYAKAKDAAKNGAPDPGKNPPWEAMLPVVRGEIPITIHAEEVRQIRAAVKWAETNQFKIALAGGRDAWKVADLLATNKIPVIYDNVFTQPSRDSDAYDVHFTRARSFAKSRRESRVRHRHGERVAGEKPAEWRPCGTTSWTSSLVGSPCLSPCVCSMCAAS